jgi:hypothetical protein
MGQNYQLVLAKERILAESTSIGADIRNLEYLELEYTLDIEMDVLPFAKIVTQLSTRHLVIVAIVERNAPNARSTCRRLQTWIC